MRKMLLTMRPNTDSIALVAGLLLCVLPVSACTQGEPDKSYPPPSVSERASPRRGRIVALGDSLMAGYGLPPEKAPPTLLQRRLEAEGYDLEVINAGVPGDTSAGGASRLEWVLDGDVQVLIVALGANDGLRGLPVSQMKRNLARIIERARARGVDVLLAGMEAPPNQGETYTTQFRKAYRDLALQYDVVLFPFLLEGVAGIAELNQRDGIHPNAEGARVVADYLWVYLQPMLDEALAR